MKKIKNLFERIDRKIINKIRPSSQWVADGEGTATAKFDGTCCLVKDGKLYARYDLKPEKSKRKKEFINNPYVREDFKSPPEGFIECDDSDMGLGHIMGWIPVEGNEKFYPHHAKAFKRYYIKGDVFDGTYELVGPKIQGNPYERQDLELWLHGSFNLDDLHKFKGIGIVPRDFEGLKQYLLSDFPYEGIVWHRDNGDMVKLRVNDFKNLEE
jgi:hypothetical protein